MSLPCCYEDISLPKCCVNFILTAVYILTGKAVKSLLEPLTSHMPLAITDIKQPPYGAGVLPPAYTTYLELTIAAFIIFNLIKHKLTKLSTFMKGIVLGILISMLHAGIYSIVQIIYSHGNIFYRIYYYGQFLWEYFTLGLLTAYSFHLFENR